MEQQDLKKWLFALSPAITGTLLSVHIHWSIYSDPASRARLKATYAKLPMEYPGPAEQVFLTLFCALIFSAILAYAGQIAIEFYHHPIAALQGYLYVPVSILGIIANTAVSRGVRAGHLHPDTAWSATLLITAAIIWSWAYAQHTDYHPPTLARTR